MIYILKFSKALGNPDKKYGTAGYYLGYCDEHRLDERLAEHRAGLGAKITRAAVQQGLTLELVLTIPNGDRTLERKLKNWKSQKRVIERYQKQSIPALDR